MCACGHTSNRPAHLADFVIKFAISSDNVDQVLLVAKPMKQYRENRETRKSLVAMVTNAAAE